MKKKQRNKDEQIVRLEQYQRFFSEGDGQAVLFDLMDQCFFIKPTFDPDTNLAIRNEGRREVVLYILEQCNRDVPELLKFIEKQESERGKDYD